MCRVIDDPQSVRAGDLENRIHVSGESGKVDRKYHLRAGSDRALDQAGIDVQRLWIDVDEHRVCAEIADNLRACSEGVRSGDHLIARTYADGLEGEVQAGSCRIHCDGDGVASNVCREFILELLCLGASCDPPRAKAGDDLVDLFLPDVRSSERKEGVGYDFGIQQRQWVRSHGTRLTKV